MKLPAALLGQRTTVAFLRPHRRGAFAEELARALDGWDLEGDRDLSRRQRGQVDGQLLALTDLVRRFADVDIPAKIDEAIRWSAPGALSAQEARVRSLTDEYVLRRGLNGVVCSSV